MPNQLRLTCNCPAAFPAPDPVCNSNGGQSLPALQIGSWRCGEPGGCNAMHWRHRQIAMAQELLTAVTSKHLVGGFVHLLLTSKADASSPIDDDTQ
jgi:hypothetical protein